MKRLKDLETKMNAAPDKQISLIDPDARPMVLSGSRDGIHYGAGSQITDIKPSSPAQHP